MARTQTLEQGVGLPVDLPDSPMPTVASWLAEAMRRRDQPNPNAMALATAGADGLPSVRQVLCKDLNADEGWVVFYTNLDSAKGRDLKASPQCEACFYWDHMQRQARVGGHAIPTSNQEDDAYFASRPLLSQLGAWASDQSKPIESRAALDARLVATAKRFGTPGATLEPGANDAANTDVVVPRPPNWGGFRLWIDSVELWVGMPGRLHDRAKWRRTLQVDQGAVTTQPWSATRLQP